MGWLPKHIRDKAARLLERCPRGILVELAVYLYGDLASGFYYELRRNNDFKAEGAIQRGNSSVFKYKEQIMSYVRS